MGEAIKNPFKFGDPVDGEFFLPRPSLENAVTQFLKSKIHIVLIGPRRMGKTSFVLHLLKKMQKEKFSYLYIDIFNITSHKDFLLQLNRALKDRMSLSQKMRSTVKGLKKIRPIVKIDPDIEKGSASLSVTADVLPDDDVKNLILETFQEIAKLDQKVIVAIDEFQKVAELDDKGWLETTLRTQMQQLKNVSFLFTGSRRRIIHEMINQSSRPFFRSCQPVDFTSFGPEFTDWIVGRFKSIHISCENNLIDKLRDLVLDTPNYVQMVCFHLVLQKLKKISEGHIHKTLEYIVKQNSYAYQTILGTLSSMQQRALRLAAFHGEQVFSQELLDLYEISSRAALASAIKSLKDKQILDEGTEKGRVYFDDPLFPIWIRYEFSSKHGLIE